MEGSVKCYRGLERVQSEASRTWYLGQTARHAARQPAFKCSWPLTQFIFFYNELMGAPKENCWSFHFPLLEAIFWLEKLKMVVSCLRGRMEDVVSKYILSWWTFFEHALSVRYSILTSESLFEIDTVINPRLGNVISEKLSDEPRTLQPVNGGECN